jgi:hypothetical protein
MADPALWFPGARLNQLASVDGGSILGGRPKLLWHKTVSSGFPSYSSGFWPHFTLHPGTGEVRQHIPANRAARALRNESGGVQTNRWNCLQVEVVGPVDDGAFHPVMADLALWARDRRGVPLVTSVDWHRPYNNGQVPSSFGSWPGRLSGGKWLDYTGHLAHMHCPENVHGDTGWPFPISQILTGRPEPELPKGDDDMPFILRADGDRALKLVAGGQATSISNDDRSAHTAAGVTELNYTGHPDAYDTALELATSTPQALRNTLVRAELALASGQDNAEFKSGDPTIPDGDLPTDERLVRALHDAAGVAHLIEPPPV